MKRREAFTLIEMLIVIAVIGILAGISFKMVQIAKRNADRAQTIAKLEKVAHALNEFKAEYGIYPPVEPGVCPVHSGCSICYVYENTNSQSTWLNENYFVDNPDEMKFAMGLVAYLDTRYKGSQIGHTNSSSWVPDTSRDEQAKARWAHFLDGVFYNSAFTNYVEGTPYADSYQTIRDSWGNVIHYQCDSPFMSYRLWSGGPTADASDDLHKDRWDD